MKKPSVRARRVSAAARHRHGEAAEMYFCFRSAREGLIVLLPWGSCQRYDVVLDNGNCLIRVQVKATNLFACDSFHVKAITRRGPYTGRQVDFIAVLVVPMNTWYIIPISKIAPTEKNLSFAPHVPNSQAKYEQFREAWHLLKQKRSRPSAAKSNQPAS
jgi:hypothetical protein